MFVPSSLGIAINGNPSNEAFRRECLYLVASVSFLKTSAGKVIDQSERSSLGSDWLGATRAFIPRRGLARSVWFCERGLTSSSKRKITRKVTRLFALSVLAALWILKCNAKWLRARFYSSKLCIVRQNLRNFECILCIIVNRILLASTSCDSYLWRLINFRNVLQLAFRDANDIDYRDKRGKRSFHLTFHISSERIIYICLRNSFIIFNIKILIIIHIPKIFY